MASKPPDPDKTKGAHSLRSDSQAADESSTKEFGVKPLENFDATQFPTNFDVLGRYVFERNKAAKKPLKSIAFQIYDELLLIYQNGLDIPQPTKMKHFCITYICNFVNEWLKAGMHFRQGRKLSSKEESFVSDLPKMFDIISADAEQQINNDRNRPDKDKKIDIDFLRDQRNERCHRIGKKDVNYAQKIDKKIARNKNLLQDNKDQKVNVGSNKPKQQPMEIMPTRLRSRKPNPELKYVGAESEAESPTFLGQRKNTPDPTYKLSPFLREKRDPRQKSKTSLAKDPATLMALDREKVTDRGATRILAPAIVATGGDILKTTHSRSTIQRERKKVRAVEAAEIKSSFQKPEHGNIHFDGKLVWESGEKAGHLAVVLSGGPNCKILSAKMIEDGTGKSEANEVLSSLKDWDLQSCICSMCFDTTSTNTGWIKGACVLIEKGLDRPLLWLACRHHIPELLLKAVWVCLFGEDMAPTIKEFEKFKANWDSLDKSNFKGLDLKPWMKEQLDIIIPFIKSLLESKKQPRDDYKECLELVLVVLGCPLPKNFSFKKPGAYHKARWMAPLIYGLKMFLFRFQISKNKKYHEKLERFAIFASLFYSELWFRAPIAADAPFMDLKFYKNMLKYKKIDLDVANAALDKFLGHTWYLNQELVPFSLFSKNISDKEKAEIAKKLTKVIPPKKYELGYPNPVPLAKNATGLKRKLSDSVMSGSLFIFDQLGFGKEWLYEPVAEWGENANFLKMQTWIQNLKVTNDCAERGVKLMSDFANTLTKDSTDKQNLLQVVERQRELFPSNVTKATLAKNLAVSKKS